MGIFLNYIIPLLLLVGFLLLQLTLPAHFSERVKEKEKTWNTVLNLLYGGKKAQHHDKCKIKQKCKIK